MKVEKFVHDYRIANKIKDGGINFVKEHIVKEYVPYMEKMARCQTLVNTCWYKTDSETGVKRLSVNNSVLNVMFIMELVRQYTDIQLEYEGTKVVESYDDLRKTGILNKILGSIPKTDRDEFQSVLNMVKSDVMTNEYEIGAYIRNRINDGMTIIGNLILPALENAGFTKEDLTTLLSSPDLRNYISSLKK